MISFGKEAIELGSDLQEVQNVVDVTFTTMSDKVNEFAQGAAEAAGLSETMAKKYVGTFGAMAKAFGFAETESFDMATALTQLTGDVASFYNLTQDEAYTKLKSVFTGETESLKELGVVMTQNALDSFAMANGWGKTTAQMEEQEKVALRYAFVQKQLSAASGDFIRTQDSWANQMRILNLNFDSFKANIGQALINVFTPFLQILNQLVGKMAELSSKFVAFSELITGRGSSGGGSPGEALADISGGYDDVADSTKKATKAQNKYLSGLDELNVLSQNQDIESGGVGAITPYEEAVAPEKGNENLEDTVSLLDIMRDKLDALSSEYPIIEHLTGVIVGTFELLEKVFTDLFELVTKPFTDNSDGFLMAATNIGKFLLDIYGRVIEGWDFFIEELNRVYDETIGPVIDHITEDVSNLVGNFLTWFNEDMSPVLERWGDKFDEVWTNHIDPLATKFAEFYGFLAEEVQYLWDELFAPFFEWLTTVALPFLTPAIEEIGNALMDFGGLMADIVGDIIDVLKGLIKFTTATFTGDWEKAWNGIVDILKGIVNTAIRVFEDFINRSIIDPFNALIGSINDLVNMAGSVIGLDFQIPTFSHINIPKLATGAVIPPNAPFVAMLGDQRHGTNLEAPEDLIRQIVREEAGASREMLDLLLRIAESNQVIAEKEFAVGDREVAKANLRGKQSLGFLGGALVTTVGGR